MEKNYPIPDDKLNELIEIAENPNTLPEKLTELSQIDEFELRKVIAINKNTPNDVIEALIDDPTFDYSLLMSEKRAFPAPIQKKLEISTEIRSKIFGEKNPDELRELFVNAAPKFMIIFAINDHTPPDLLENMFSRNIIDLNRLIASNPNTPPSLFEKLLGTNDEKTLTRLAGNSKTPPHLLSEIIKKSKSHQIEDKNNQNITLLVRNPNTPVNVLRKIYEESKDTKNIVYSIANHGNTDTELLNKILAEKEDIKLKTSIAHHPQTSPNALEALVDEIQTKPGQYFEHHYLPRDSEKTVVFDLPDFFHFTKPEYLRLGNYLARNPNTPPSALEKLFKLGWSFKGGLSLNPNAPEHIQKQAMSELSALSKVTSDETEQAELDMFIDHYHPFVRSNVASNPNTSLDSLSKLADDDNIIVQMGLASNINTPGITLEKLSYSSYMPIRWRVAKNPSTPNEVLYAMIEDVIQIQIAIAENPNSSIKIIEELIAKNDLFLDRGLAKNPSTPKNIVEKLSNKEDYHIKCGVAINPNASEAVLDKLVVESKLDSLSSDETDELYEAVAKNTNTSTGTIIKIFETNPNIRIKKALIDNPRTPPEIQKDILESLITEFNNSNNDPNLNEPQKRLRIRQLKDQLKYLLYDPSYMDPFYYENLRWSVESNRHYREKNNPGYYHT